MKVLVVLACVGICSAFPQFSQPPAGQLVFGVDAEGCTVGPSGKVCPTGPVQFTSAAQGVPQPFVPQPAAPVHHVPQAAPHTAFTGLVGPSGVIGPSGLVGPAGPVAFGK